MPFSILLNLHADLADVGAAEATFAELSRRKLPCSTREFTSLMKVCSVYLLVLWAVTGFDHHVV